MTPPSLSHPAKPAASLAAVRHGRALLEEMAATIEQAAVALAAVLDRRAPAEATWQTIRDQEHKGDAIARDLFDLLAAGGEVPVDRPALQALVGLLDDVLDAIEAAAARLAIHRVRRPIQPAQALGQAVLEAARELHQAIAALGRAADIFPHTRALHRQENHADDVLREAIEHLFANGASARDIIKWKDICEFLEAATDRCEDIANVLETLVVRAGHEGRLTAGHVVLDVERHEVTVAGQPVPVSVKEFEVLRLLLRHQGKVVRRQRLLHDVWGDDYVGDTRTLDTHVGWLRKKLEARGGVRLVSVRGIGYRLDLVRA
ncbi:MAG: DUF47 family protein [Armatimonadota bacterium]|nr:DUF47 family protein [Armatimonadota bacterium]